MRGWRCPPGEMLTVMFLKAGRNSSKPSAVRISLANSIHEATIFLFCVCSQNFCQYLLVEVLIADSSSRFTRLFYQPRYCFMVGSGLRFTPLLDLLFPILLAHALCGLTSSGKLTNIQPAITFRKEIAYGSLCDRLPGPSFFVTFAPSSQTSGFFSELFSSSFTMVLLSVSPDLWGRGPALAALLPLVLTTTPDLQGADMMGADTVAVE